MAEKGFKLLILPPITVTQSIFLFSRVIYVSEKEIVSTAFIDLKLSTEGLKKAQSVTRQSSRYLPVAM